MDESFQAKRWLGNLVGGSLGTPSLKSKESAPLVGRGKTTSLEDTYNTLVESCPQLIRIDSRSFVGSLL